MRFWGLLGGGIALASILAYKLDEPAFALLAGVIVMAIAALFFTFMFASRSQYEVQRAPVQQQQPVAPVVIVLAGSYQPQQLQAPDYLPCRRLMPPMQQNTADVWQQPVDVWEEEAQPQRRFKVVGEKELYLSSQEWER